VTCPDCNGTKEKCGCQDCDDVGDCYACHTFQPEEVAVVVERLRTRRRMLSESQFFDRLGPE
jgi:hypothetical protein